MKAQGAATVEAALAKVRASAKSAEKDLTGFDNALTNLGSEFKGLLGGLGIVAVLGKIATETTAAQFAQADLAAALKSTNGVVGLTTEQLNRHAEALAQVSLHDDDAITGAQTLLLTFKQIRGPIFTQATEAVLDLAQRFGGDLRSAAVQVGKALDDPLRGLTALARVGVNFSDAQKSVIEQLVKTNQVAEAQRVILAELESQTKGSALAARNTFGGALKVLANEIGNLAELSDDNAGGAARAINNLSMAIRGLNNVLSNTPGLIDRMNNGFNRLPSWLQDFIQSIPSRITPGFFPFAMLLKQGAKATEELGRAAEKAGPAVDGLINPPTSGVDTVDWDQRTKDFDAWMTSYREKQRQMARDAMTARNMGSVTRGESIVPAPVTQIGAGAAAAMRASVRESVAVTGEIVNSELATQMQEVRDTFSRGFAEALGAGLANGFQVALSSKSISQGFKALTGTIFSSFGSLLVQFGTKALIANEAIQNMFKFLFTPGPKSAIAAAAIIAIGAGLQAAGQGILSSAAKGGGSSPIGSYVTGAPAPSGMMGPQMVFGGTMAGQSGSIAAATPVNVTIIGPNDPSAQRQMQELIEKANRRGNTRV